MDFKNREARQPAFHPEKELKNWGLTPRDFTQLSSLEARRDGKTGAQVHTVAQGGPSSSSKPQLVENDVITEVDGQPIHQISDLIEITRERTAGQTEAVPVLVKFERNLANYLTVVKIGPEAEEKRLTGSMETMAGCEHPSFNCGISRGHRPALAKQRARLSQVFPQYPS